ncbi:MAG TPA: CDGSH iron-sulfur domain-containing protein [Acidimicrobiales bacterium]|nr:CDGSH iron-sulfur domain-containing protein [Acidimicrobiales bacterium]
MTESDVAHIAVQPNGPYLVSGSVSLTRRQIVRSEQGEPMTWQTTDRLEKPATFALCRCGGSANKPFCDGTHAGNGFDGTETAPTDSYDDRAATYEATGVVVRDDRAICEHAGFCGNRLTTVWKMARGSATEDTVVRAQMMSMIEHCPSGALSYRLDPEGDDVEPDLSLGIAVTKDGPYFVTGGVAVERADGLPFERRNRVTLCRCGQSSNKPLCDGSHQRAEFRDG